MKHMSNKFYPRGMPLQLSKCSKTKNILLLMVIQNCTMERIEMLQNSELQITNMCNKMVPPLMDHNLIAYKTCELI